MPTAERAKLQYEAGQIPVAMAALTDSGDHTIFNAASSPWSQRSGYTPVVRPNGLITGGAIIPAVSSTNNLVDVAAGTAYLGGALVTWVADTDVAATRGADANICCITSITVTDAGAVAAIAGKVHTAFSETRDANGGPPFIPVTSIEIGQVRLGAVAAADVAAAEIFATVGTHLERYDYPIYEIDHYGGDVTMVSALPLIHTGAVPKKVCASYSTPVFADVQKASDFVPPENSYSVSSTQIYGQTLGSTSASIKQGAFTAYMEDGVSDGLMTQEGQTLWFKFYPDQYKGSYVMSQGKLGVTRSFPAGDSIRAACTINAEGVATNVAG
jgi:hypothetical protein